MAHAFSHDFQGARDYYQVLNVPRTATPDEIRRAYRSLALQYHPDRNAGSKEAEERFKELAEAFHTLSDTDRRELYDVWGPEARRTVVDAASPDLDDAVAVFVRQFSQFVQEELPEVPDFVDVGAGVPYLPFRVKVTLAEVATGACKEVPLPCVRCSGTGVTPGRGGADRKCPTCEGSGEDAAGETVLVDVPPGALGGDCVRVSRPGRGDLLAFIEVEEDPRFVRAGADVVLELPISARRGRGSEIEVPTPTGSTLVKIPKGPPVGGALRIPGQGLPARSRPGRGDLIVKLVEEEPEPAVALAAAGPSRAVARPVAGKVATAGLAFLLGGVTVAVIGRVGPADATAEPAGLAASAAESAPVPAAPAREGASGEQDSEPDPGVLAAPGAGAAAGSSPLLPAIPAAPELGDLSLPAALDIAPTYSDQPIASLSPVRPEPRSNARSGRGLTAITQTPQVRNAEQVRQSLESEYPIGFREAKIGGRVEMTFDIDERGRVESFRIRESSGYRELDAAAARVARVFEFTPALRGTQPVAASVSLGISFGESAAASQSSASTPAPRAGGADQPVPAEFDVPPEVRNTDRVRQSLANEYPIGLRDAGVGGNVDMWFYVNERGVAERFQIRQGSGHTALDEAALRVARVFQFAPARRDNRAIATWISLRITFVGGDPD